MLWPKRTKRYRTLEARFKAAHKWPLAQRCGEFYKIMHEANIKELQSLYPLVVQNIFSFGTKEEMSSAHDLKNISRNYQCTSFEQLRRFLSPTGPMIRFAYKLMSDCYIQFDFPVECLPSSTRRMLNEGMIPFLYQNKLHNNVIFLNAFEYYLFHLAYFIINPRFNKISCNWAVPGEALCPTVVDEFLQYFLPADGSFLEPVDIAVGNRLSLSPSLNRLSFFPPSSGDGGVRPVGPSSPYAATSTPFARPLGLLKSKCTPKLVASPPVRISDLAPVETWRSETVVQIFSEMWLTHDDDEEKTRFSSVAAALEERFHTNFEQVRVVRMLVKHLHYFSNSIGFASTNPLEDLKRNVIPLLIQKKLYFFLKYSVRHWPLDASFRLVLETWLSYIQPWRYIDIRTQPTGAAERVEEDILINDMWQKFVAENLAFYTCMFQQILPRFLRVDMSMPKNAHMLFRVLKVYSQHGLRNLIATAELSVVDQVPNFNPMIATPSSPYLGPMPTLNRGMAAAVRQNLIELEQSSHYSPLYGSEVVPEVQQLMHLAFEARCRVKAAQKTPEAGNGNFWVYVGRAIGFLLSWTNTSSDYADDSPTDSRRLEQHLETICRHLCMLFKLQEPTMLQNNADDGNLQSSDDDEASHGTRSGLSISTSLNRSARSLIPLRPTRPTDMTFQGNPDLQPIRSYEFVFLVRLLHQLATQLNEKYGLELRQLYQRRDFVGFFSKQFIMEPATYYETNKAIYPPVRRELTLPPRLGFRCLAHQQVTGYLAFFFLCGYIFGFNPLKGLFLFFCIILIGALLRASMDTLGNLMKT